MRRRYAWIGLLFTASVALFVVPLIAPPHAIRPGPATPSPARTAPDAKQEADYKQQAVERDKAATERLCRIQCSRDARLFADAAAGRTPGQIKAKLGDMVRKHPEMRFVQWTDGKNSSTAGSFPAAVRRTAAPYWKKAADALRAGQNYESPAFHESGQSFYVLAEPGRRTGAGFSALVDISVVREVEKHQRRNLRLIPYPAEGRYRIESVGAGSRKDITVRQGDQNGHASHFSVDEAVVKFRSPLDDAELLRLRRELDLTVVRHAGRTGHTYLFRSKSRKTDQLIAFFRRYPGTVYAEPHYLYLTNDFGGDGSGADGQIIPNDTLYSRYQWNLPRIATEKGWNVTKGSKDVIVAIVDTGVQADHPDLQGRLVPGINIVDPNSPPDDDVGHGTHVAGIIAADVNNNEGVAGMTWYTKIMPVKALDSSGAGTTYSVAEGIIWATDHGAQVINLSLGNYAQTNFLHDAVKYAFDHGVVLVAASGNDNTDRPGYPAAYPEVFAVSATDPDDSRASYSNYGDYIDVVAPGTQIASTFPGSRYAALSGTSMACPHVSALASLVRAANPQLGNAEVMDLLRQTARDLGPAGKDNDYGYGQIDVNAAVEAAGNGANSLQLFPQRLWQELRRIGILSKSEP
jgi:hypothetical protein